MAAAANSGAEEPSTDRIETLGYPDEVEDESSTMANAMEGFKTAREMAQDGHSREEIRTELKQGVDLQGAVLTVVIAGATAFVGISVMSSIGESMSLTSGDMFYNSSVALQEGIQGFFTNLPTVFIVLALVLVISYITLLRN